MPVHRRLALFALAGLGLSACQPGSGRLADRDRDAIHAAVNNSTKAVPAGEFTTASSYYAEDGMLLPPNGTWLTTRAIWNSDVTGRTIITSRNESHAYG